jgi:pimeloyl-ACP methyl ester carboxylesterase
MLFKTDKPDEARQLLYFKLVNFCYNQFMLIKTKSFTLAINSKGDPNSAKLALVLPGKLDTKDYAHMISHVDYLSKLGYFAVSFDPSGTWESPGDISLYNMTNYAKAIDELIEYYGNKQTFVMGHSRGATMATISGVRNPYATAFAAIMSTFRKGGFNEKVDSQWKESGFWTSTRDLPPGGGPKEKEFNLPYSFFEDQMQYNLTDDLTSSTKPKLFIYGTEDDMATPQIVRETYEKFSKPKELYELKSDHDYRLHPELIEEVNKVIEDFLRKYKQV